MADGYHRIESELCNTPTPRSRATRGVGLSIERFAVVAVDSFFPVLVNRRSGRVVEAGQNDQCSMVFLYGNYILGA